jgi:hypothetical protein
VVAKGANLRGKTSDLPQGQKPAPKGAAPEQATAPDAGP